MYALKRGNIDVAVTVCDGAGTVITSNPSVVQGIGAYMNGLFYTTPIKNVIRKIEENGGFVLTPDKAEIDQLKGVKNAFAMGFRNIAVTVRGDEKEIIKDIRNFEEELKSADNSLNIKYKGDGKPVPFRIVILTVCNTGIDKESAEIIRDYADLSWACASKFVREVVGPPSIMQVGVKIPVFILTVSGLDFISSYSSDEILKEELKDIEKKHYITSNKYRKDSIKINMGKFSVFLYETGSLPVCAEDEPEPLI